MTNIYVDADACPVVRLTEQIAQKYKIFTNTELLGKLIKQHT